VSIVDNNSNNGLIGMVEKTSTCSTVAKCSAYWLLLGHRRAGGTSPHRAELSLTALSEK